MFASSGSMPMMSGSVPAGTVMGQGVQCAPWSSLRASVDPLPELLMLVT